MSTIVAPIAPQRKQSADDEVLGMFRKDQPKVIPQEEAHKIREAVLSGEKKKPAPVPPKAEKPKAEPPKAQKPQQEKASAREVPAWIAENAAAKAQHRLRISLMTMLITSCLASASWFCMRTGDVTPRIAFPAIVICHLVSIGALIWAWRNRE